MASTGLTAEEQKLVDDFKRDVVEPSMTQIVVLDFWAEWCGPCKALAPMLEKVVGEYAAKGVKLVKINVDENKFIASQFQVQSIPTVYALFQGQPVADLTQARSESQLKSVLDQLLEKLPVKPGGDSGQPDGAGKEQDITPLLAMGDEVLDAGDAERAKLVFGQILEMKPDSAEAMSGLIRATLSAGDKDQAEAMLGQVPEDMAKDPAFDRARSALAMAEEAVDPSRAAELKSAVAANPDNHETRFEYANALWSGGERDAAADELLTIVRQDRTWNEDAARARLLQMFETVGLEDPWVSETRRKLSAVLFG